MSITVARWDYKEHRVEVQLGCTFEFDSHDCEIKQYQQPRVLVNGEDITADLLGWPESMWRNLVHMHIDRLIAGKECEE